MRQETNISSVAIDSKEMIFPVMSNLRFGEATSTGEFVPNGKQGHCAQETCVIFATLDELISRLTNIRQTLFMKPQNDLQSESTWIK